MGAETWNLRTFGKGVATLRRSHVFRGGATNATYSVAEYVTQPLLMLAAAPFLVHRLGLDLYGIWMLVSAIAGTFGIFNLGLGDATVKYVSAYRGRNDLSGAIRILRTTLTITAVVGAVAAALIFLAAPLLAERVFKVEPQYQQIALRAIQLGGLVLFLRAVDWVLVSVLRAFEEYGLAARNSVLVRVFSMVCAVALVAMGHGVVAIMAATAATVTLGIILQALSVRKTIPGVSFAPSFGRNSWAEIRSFGFYTWLQNVAGVAFSQADRLLIGALLGTAAVAYYSICMQLAQSVHSVLSAAFNLVFPHISARREAGDARGSQRVYRFAVAINVFAVVLICLPLMLFGKQILSLWMGSDFAEHSNLLLVVLVVAFGALSMNIVPHYTLLALGKARFIAVVNLAGGALTLAGAALLIPSIGLVGAAVARLLYAPIITLNYRKVARTI
jgi:O-antigen/teichoic acid export membrane protein